MMRSMVTFLCLSNVSNCSPDWDVWGFANTDLEFTGNADLEMATKLRLVAACREFENKQRLATTT